jgi:hypothetical protein
MPAIAYERMLAAVDFFIILKYPINIIINSTNPKKERIKDLVEISL